MKNKGMCNGIFRQKCPDARPARGADEAHTKAYVTNPTPSITQQAGVFHEKSNFSVIIPLYNKEAEVSRTLQSVLAQTLTPLEIVIVDDGSTDNSAAIVEKIAAETATRTNLNATPGVTPEIDPKSGPKAPVIRLIRQKNAGETAARNRAMAEAKGDFFALIDADDEWRPEFLAEIDSLIRDFPDCGLYSTGFDIVNTDGEHPAKTPSERGVVDNFFRESMSAYVSIPSASVLSRKAVAAVGGFPEGMRLGGDQYMWTKIALKFPVCFSPKRLTRYYMAASNRSAAIYKPEQTAFSFEDFYDAGGGAAGSVAGGTADCTARVAAGSEAGAATGSGDFWLNEYIARVALGKALVISVKGGTTEGRRAEKFFAYNRHSRRLWWRLWVLNRLPTPLRPRLHALYTDLAWRLAKRGL